MDLAQTLVGARESLTRYAMSLCRRRADAEDLVQTAFLRALERAARTSPRLWAFPPPRCARGCARPGCTFKSTWKPKARKDDTFMKPLVLKNIAVLDARRLTEEKAQNIRLIRDVAVVLVTRQTASLLHTVPLKDVAKVSVVPGEDENVNVLSVNGAHTFSPDPASPCFLMINGALLIHPDATPQDIRAAVSGGEINGHVEGTAAQVAALAQKQIKLLAGKRVFVRAGDLEALGGVYEGDLSLLTVVPEGYALRKDDLKLDTHNAPSVSGRVFLTGELFAQPGALKRSRLEKLRMSRTAYVPLSEMDDWLGVLEGDAEWMPYEGRLTLNESQMCLTSLTQPQAIVNDGMLTLDAAPDALENVTLLVNNGQLIADDAQVSALGERLIQRGGLSPREPAPGKPEETFEGCTVVSDLANYIL